MKVRGSKIVFRYVETGWFVAEMVKVRDLKMSLWCVKTGWFVAGIVKVRDKRLVENWRISKVGLSLL